MIPEIQKLEKETLLPKLEEFFKEREYVELAYLFGSHKRKIRPTQ